MSLPSINFLHLTVSEIQPGQIFSRRPPTHLDTMGENNTPTDLKGCGVKTGPRRSTPYEAHTVASQKLLEGPRVTRKGDTCSQVAPPSSEMVAGGKQCAPRLTITSTKTCQNMLCSCLQTHQKKGGVLTYEHSARVTWSLPESKLLTIYLEPKAVF